MSVSQNKYILEKKIYYKLYAREKPKSKSKKDANC